MCEKLPGGWEVCWVIVSAIVGFSKALGSPLKQVSNVPLAFEDPSPFRPKWLLCLVLCSFSFGSGMGRPGDEDKVWFRRKLFGAVEVFDFFFCESGSL